MNIIKRGMASLFCTYSTFVEADSGRLDYDQVNICLFIITDIVIQPTVNPDGINIFLNLG